MPRPFPTGPGLSGLRGALPVLQFCSGSYFPPTPSRELQSNPMRPAGSLLLSPLQTGRSRGAPWWGGGDGGSGLVPQLGCGHQHKSRVRELFQALQQVPRLPPASVFPSVDRVETLPASQGCGEYPAVQSTIPGALYCLLPAAGCTGGPNPNTKL